MAESSAKRRAIVLIHGIGEQRPMSTLRSFVESLLEPVQGDLEGAPLYYVKPDTLDDTFELRQLIVTKPSKVDFYEYYWAHLMPDTTWNRVINWFWLMMWRKPGDVPRRIFPLWLSSWLILIAILGLLIGDAVSHFSGAEAAATHWPALLSLALAALSGSLLAYIGDAAVYFGQSPKNIEARQQIRARGLQLLNNLMRDERYASITVVGHSLGSVIGYDAISLCWQDFLRQSRERYLASCNAGAPLPANIGAVMKAERAAKAQPESFNLDDWRNLTAAVRAELAGNGHNWKICDFITLGSPLTHANLLMATSNADFAKRKRQRELPTCPPTREEKGFSYYQRIRDARGKWRSIRMLHHAAQFAATDWTNIYFVSRRLPSGDLVGGPVAPLFGPGVRDIPVTTNIRFGLLSHIRYWQRPRGGQVNMGPTELDRIVKLEAEKNPTPTAKPPIA